VLVIEAIHPVTREIGISETSSLVTASSSSESSANPTQSVRRRHD